jgi:hypothetical protein
MSLQYGEVPPGAIVNIPPAIPSAMLYRIKSISGLSKQTVKWLPISGQTSVTKDNR